MKFFHVVMPVGSNPDKEEVQKVIANLASENNISPHFPCYASENPVFNLQSTLQDLRACKFVLVDLTLERPSCYYELGLAEALGKPVFIIAKEGTEIHQTAARNFVSFYKNKDELVKVLHKILAEGNIDG